MPFPVLGSNSAVAGGYEIDNSGQFEPNAYLVRYDGVGDEPSNAGKIGTVSLWTKRGDLGREQGLFVVYEHNGQGYQTIWFNSDDNLQLRYEISGTEYQVKTNAKFRDPSAWYHVVAMTDTTQGTDSNRMKIYVNGTEQTYSSTAYPPQDTTLLWGKGSSTNYQYHIGRKRGLGSTTYAHYSGYITEVHVCMGQNYTASEFGETNDNGVWIPKKADVSYGTNGGFYEFKQTGTSADASGIGADTSGNGNHADVGGLDATNITTDTPTNNFCTMNPLDNFVQGSTFSEGNCQVVTAVSPNTWNTGTFGVANGKWYYELKVTELGETEGTNYMNVGWASSMATTAQESMSFLPYNYAYASDNGNVKSNNTSGTTHGATYGTDIIGVALDLENNTIAFSKNGLWADNSGNSDESNINGTISIQGASGTPTGFYFPSFGDNVQGDGMTAQLNFGNPPFAISSGNSDANGYGNFEYAVPSGYYALCTKNLAEYG
jgi:hypothetical protein